MVVLIIDDEKDVAEKMKRVLMETHEITDVLIHTLGVRRTPEGKLRLGFPPFDDIKEAIQNSDLILIDHNLGHSCDYSGNDIFAFCQELDKMTIGISSIESNRYGQFNFHGKLSVGEPMIDIQLKKVVRNTLLAGVPVEIDA